MSDFGDFLSDGLAEMEPLLGSPTFLWRTYAVACIPSTLERGTVIESGGAAIEVRLALYVRQGAAPNSITADNGIITVDTTAYRADSTIGVLSAGHTLVYKSRTYRIGSISEAVGGSHYVLKLVDANSGR